MAKFFATQTLTIIYGKEIEADTEREAHNIAIDCGGDLDDWKEIDCQSGDNIYVEKVWEEGNGQH